MKGELAIRPFGPWLRYTRTYWKLIRISLSPDR
jgi:hypothetical protein